MRVTRLRAAAALTVTSEVAQDWRALSCSELYVGCSA